MAKATFYKHFPAKDDLVVAYLDKVDGIWTGQLHEAAAAGRRPGPADQLVGLFDALAHARAAARATAAARFINAAAESQPGTAVHDRTVAHKTAVLAWVQRPRRAGRRAATPRPLARSLTLLLDGGLASGSLDAGPGGARGREGVARAPWSPRATSDPPPSCRAALRRGRQARAATVARGRPVRSRSSLHVDPLPRALQRRRQRRALAVGVLHDEHPAGTQQHRGARATASGMARPSSLPP